MTQPAIHRRVQPPPHGQVGYLQLPALDVARSATFYEAVFGWSVGSDNGSFEAPGLIGQLTTDLKPASSGGPLVWICADELSPLLDKVVANGGAVHGRPQLDNGERWLVEVDDPAGNRIGIVVLARTARSQTMIAVRDVEASSRWYQELLGLRSDHGGPEYERLLADGELVLQLHHIGTEHHHGPIADPRGVAGNGVLLWFGDTSDFDGVVVRAGQLGVAVVRPPHRNPPEGQGNGPGHREIWLRDPDGYTVVVASPDGEAYESATSAM
jgi:predicted enzyme related to lactoylglutathione lyase